MRAEINKIETRKAIQKNQCSKELVFRENQQDRQTFIQTNRKQRERVIMQINKIRNEKRDITTDTEEIQTTFRSYFEPVLYKI